MGTLHATRSRTVLVAVLPAVTRAKGLSVVQHCSQASGPSHLDVPCSSARDRFQMMTAVPVPAHCMVGRPGILVVVAEARQEILALLVVPLEGRPYQVAFQAKWQEALVLGFPAAVPEESRA